MKKMLMGVIGAVVISAGVCGAEDKPVELFPVKQGGKWGYIDKAGKIAIKPHYDMAWDFSEGLAAVEVALKRGYIDAQGTMAIKAEYDLTGPFSEGVAAVLTNASPAGTGILFNYGGGEWGYIDKTGKPAFAVRGISGKLRAYAGEFHDGRAVVGVRQGWYNDVRDESISRNGFIGTGNENNRIESIYVGRYSSGLAPYEQFKAPGKFGYVSTNGTVAIERIYEGAGSFSEGLAAVAVPIDVNDPERATTWTKAGRQNLGGRNGAERSWGTNCIPLENSEAVAFGETRTFVFNVTAPAKQGKYVFQWQMQTDWRGFGELSPKVEVVVTNEVVAPAADAPKKASADAAAAATPKAPVPGKRLEDGARFVSQIVPAIMTTGQIYAVSITMKNTGATQPKWGYIDPAGKIVVAPQFQDAREFSEGLAAVCVDKKWGYVDKTGKMVIEAKYDFGNPFSEGLARVVVASDSNPPQKKHGFIDKTGKMVIEPRFDYGWNFSRGLAKVGVGDVLTAKEGYIDKTGKYVWEPKESVYGR